MQNPELMTFATTIVACIFGSGGVAIWFLNRLARHIDEKEEAKKDMKELKAAVKDIERGLVITLNNDRVIFNALRTHEINGESEEQERKMDEYLLSLLKEE